MRDILFVRLMVKTSAFGNEPELKEELRAQQALAAYVNRWKRNRIRKKVSCCTNFWEVWMRGARDSACCSWSRWCRRWSCSRQWWWGPATRTTTLPPSSCTPATAPGSSLSSTVVYLCIELSLFNKLDVILPVKSSNIVQNVLFLQYCKYLFSKMCALDINTTVVQQTSEVRIQQRFFEANDTITID